MAPLLLPLGAIGICSPFLFLGLEGPRWLAVLAWSAGALALHFGFRARVTTKDDECAGVAILLLFTYFELARYVSPDEGLSGVPYWANRLLRAAPGLVVAFLWYRGTRPPLDSGSRNEGA